MYMDLKPENIVLSEGLDTVLVNLSRIGGISRKWLAPEMKNLLKPLSKDIESRRQNDIWVLGKFLLAMAKATYNKKGE
jgi:serine/threonine protein kinase